MAMYRPAGHKKNKANQSQFQEPTDAPKRRQEKGVTRAVFVRGIRRIFEIRVHIIAIMVKFRYFERLYRLAV
jgi:hypothetical protein